MIVSVFTVLLTFTQHAHIIYHTQYIDYSYFSSQPECDHMGDLMFVMKNV